MNPDLCTISVYQEFTLCAGWSRCNSWETSAKLSGCAERIEAFEAEQSRVQIKLSATTTRAEQTEAEEDKSEDEEDEEEEEDEELGEIGSCLLTPAGTRAKSVSSL